MPNLLAFASAAVRTVNVTLIVTEQIAPNTDQACLPTSLVATQTGLANNFQQPVGWPVGFAVSLLTNCGPAPANGQVIASFSNGDPSQTLAPVAGSPGVYSGTWTPRGVSPQVTLSVTATALNLYATVNITGQATANAVPILAPNSTLHIFNPRIGGGLAPGTIVQIYGSSLATQTTQSSAIPLSTALGGTTVLIGGIAAPLYYVSPGQINAQIPFELISGNQYQVQVVSNGTLSTPDSIQVVSVSPGIAAFPTGLAIAQRYPDYSLVTEASPARPGDHIVLYLAGLGTTGVPVGSGVASPSSPLVGQVLTTALTLNGQLSPVEFSGLTPGAVGLYQINFQVPAGTPDGDLTLVVSQGGVTSNVVTLPVRM